MIVILIFVSSVNTLQREVIMTNGWIKLHRKLIENPIFLNAELLQLFIYCIMKANHEEKEIIFNGELLKIKRGQFVTGRIALGKEIKQKPTTAYKRLKILENLRICDIQSNNRFSLVTLVNYDLYQSKDLDCDSQSNNSVTTREQQRDNSVTQTRTNKNEKKNTYGEYNHIKLTDAQHQNLLNDYGESKLNQLIKMVDEGIQLKGYKYKDYNLAIRNWANRAGIKKDEIKQEKAEIKSIVKTTQRKDADLSWEEWMEKYKNINND
jgi:hypothetical protein